MSAHTELSRIEVRPYLFDKSEYCSQNCAKKAGQFYPFFRVKKIPTIAPIKIIGANRTNSHSNA